MKQNKGFTLIEMLIVIALLGALAIGLLATIDPFEQLKKGRDTATRNTVTEFYNANLRYYGTKGEFPWGTAVTFTDENLVEGAHASAALTELINAGEIKSNFSAAAGSTRMANIIVSSEAKDAEVVCFLPESKNFALDNNSIYDATGGNDANCIGSGDTSANAKKCHWCVK